MLKHLPKLALLASVPLLATGCGALEGQDDAGRGMEAMMKVLGTGAPAALTAAMDDGRPDSFRAFGLELTGDVAIDVDVPCPDGGKMKLDGSASFDTDLGNLDGWDAFGSLALEFDLDVKFRRCKVDGVKIGGEMTYALDIGVDSSTGSASLAWSYVGDLRFRGDIKGRCEIDMSASASTGDAFGDLEVRAYSGTMCGLSAEEVSEFADLSL
ncbi:MAG: hypothetical protein AB1Z98_21805 [Nannocystaceae bacterium]